MVLAGDVRGVELHAADELAAARGDVLVEEARHVLDGPCARQLGPVEVVVRPLPAVLGCALKVAALRGDIEQPTRPGDPDHLVDRFGQATLLLVVRHERARRQVGVDMFQHGERSDEVEARIRKRQAAHGSGHGAHRGRTMAHDVVDQFLEAAPARLGRRRQIEGRDGGAFPAHPAWKGAPARAHVEHAEAGPAADRAKQRAVLEHDLAAEPRRVHHVVKIEIEALEGRPLLRQRRHQRRAEHDIGREPCAFHAAGVRQRPQARREDTGSLTEHAPSVVEPLHRGWLWHGHAPAAMCAKTRAHAETTSSQSASEKAAEIGTRTSDAATRSVTGSSTSAISPDCRAYGAECSGM